MRKLFATMAVMTAIAHLGIPVLEACGAKFLVSTRSAHSQRVQRATRPANILVYQHNDDAEGVEFMTKLQEWLKGVGHRVTVVPSEGALREAATTRDFNVVMMQLDEARRLRSDLMSWSPNTAILPMADFVTRPEAARAKKEFGQMLTLPAKESQVFSVVEAAVPATSASR